MNGAEAQERRLNVSDRMLLSVDRAMRRLGGPGFETQTLVHLAGRVDRDRLRTALACLGRALMHDLQNELGEMLAELDRIPAGALNQAWQGVVSWLRSIGRALI